MNVLRARWKALPIRTRGLLMIALPVGPMLLLVLVSLVLAGQADVRYQRLAIVFQWTSIVVGISLGLLAMSLLTREIARVQHKTERALRAQQMLNQELESFSYSVSHDLRAPLRAIDGFAQALSEDARGSLEPTAQHYLDRVRAGAQRMGALLDALLTLARVSRVDLTAQPLDVSSIARTIATDLDLRPGAPATEWVIEDGLTLVGDAELMRVVLQNLIENAWKFSGRTPHPRIEVRGIQTADAASITVTDNGVGFDPQHASRLFGTFQRLHANDFPGTGIGLATVQRIVHRHGGAIHASAEVDRGASFTFSLPPAAEA